MYNLFDLKGKKAIVTGGSKGIGYALAEALYQAGVEIVIVARNEEMLKKAAEKISKTGENIHYIQGDLSVQEDIKSIYENALELLKGRIDILVNCAGVQYRSYAKDFPLEQWNKIIHINLTATFMMSQLAGKTMLEQKYGKIINIASMTSFFGSEMVSAYSASKGGVMQLTKALSNEWMKNGINVNAIAPGYIETELIDNMKEKNHKQYQEVTNRIPAGRWGKAEELKGTVIFLSSSASDYISGAVIPVDGGYLGK